MSKTKGPSGAVCVCDSVMEVQGWYGGLLGDGR